MKVKKFIKVKFSRGGTHRFPRATEPQFATGDWDDVSFLAHPHFHYFHFTVWLSVDHDDRDVEFIQFQRWLERLYQEGTLELDYKSCEMMAMDLYAQISAEYPNRAVRIEVTEDDINGAYFEFE